MQKAISKFVFPLAEFALGRDIRSKVQRLHVEMSLPYQQRKVRQLQQLHQVLEMASNKVPYYKDLFSGIGFHADLVLKDIKYFQEIPCLTKEIIREQPMRFINTDFVGAKLGFRETNGSTGATIPIYYGQDSFDWASAVNIYTQDIIGKKEHDKEIYFNPNSGAHHTFNDKAIEFAKGLALNREVVLYENLDDDDLDKMFRAIKKSEPGLVLASPSVLYALAMYVRRNPFIRLRMNKIICTGELLDIQKKEKIEKFLNCSVFDRYGNAEVGICAHDTLNEKLKVIDYVVYLENELQIGDEVLLTNLTNQVMPLIRYRAGDLGVIEEGIDGQYVNNIHGRVHDVIYLNGRTIPTTVFRDKIFNIGYVDDFQIQKSSSSGYVLQIVATQNTKHDFIKNEIHRVWGNSLEVIFTSLDQLVRIGHRRKFQYFVDLSAH